MNMSKIVPLVAALVALSLIAPLIESAPVTNLFDMLGHGHECYGITMKTREDGMLTFEGLSPEERKEADREVTRKSKECRACCKKEGWSHSKMIREDDPDLKVCSCANEPVVDYAFGMIPNYGR